MKKIYFILAFVFVSKTMFAQYYEMWSSTDAASIVIGCEDLDNDSNLEIVSYVDLGSHFIITIIDGTTGKMEWEVDGEKIYGSDFNSPKLIDVNKDGKYELVFYGNIIDENGVAVNKKGLHAYAFGSPTKSGQISANSNFQIENYPNPFSTVTTIKYNVSVKSLVTVKVYDMNGNEIKTLENEQKDTGDYEIPFNRSDLISGTYFYQVKVGDKISAKKMVVID